MIEKLRVWVVDPPEQVYPYPVKKCGHALACVRASSLARVRGRDSRSHARTYVRCLMRVHPCNPQLCSTAPATTANRTSTGKEVEGTTAITTLIANTFLSLSLSLVRVH